MDDEPWVEWSWVGDHGDLILARLREHVELTLLAVGIGILVAVPLVVVSRRWRSLFPVVLTATGILYTVPSLALFTLLLPWTGLSRTTALIGLVGYTLLILVRNAVTGLDDVPADVREAARGMGYTDRRSLVAVELPLALPAIVAGIRLDSDREDTAVVAQDFLDESGAIDPALTGSGSIIVGSANFSEAEIVAQMYTLALEAAGYTVELKAQLGSREVLVPALESGEIDVEPEYLQSLLAFLDETTESVTPEEGVQLAAELLPEGLAVLEPSPAQDQNAIVVTAETAERYGLTKVSDLLTVTDALRMAGPPECPERPLCIPGYESVYGLQFDV